MTNDELIYNTAIGDGMPETLALFMVAQARHETGNYTHRFFTIGKNAFGYSYVRGAKWQLDKGGPNADNGIPIAQYSDVRNSVHEITDWVKRRQREGLFPTNLGTIDTPDKYAELLKKAGYYGAPLDEYLNGIIAALRKIGTEIASPAGAATILLIGLLLYAFRKKIFGR
jgi:hypothetical protein